MQPVFANVEPFRVAVGTRNPVKVEATQSVFTHYYGDSVDVRGQPLATHLPAQPIGLQTTVNGAIARATEALRADPAARHGVGIEAGLIEVPRATGGYLNQQFAAIADRSGQITLGAGPAFELPAPLLADIFQRGFELEEAVDRRLGTTEIGQHQGVVAVLSRGRMTRAQLTEYCVLMALLPRVSPI